jgi:hypothetical protein
VHNSGDMVDRDDRPRHLIIRNNPVPRNGVGWLTRRAGRCLNLLRDRYGDGMELVNRLPEQLPSRHGHDRGGADEYGGR